MKFGGSNAVTSKGRQTTARKPIKFVKGALSAPMVDIDDTSEMGIDKWRQVDLVSAVDSGLMVSVGIAEHPTKSLWDTDFWWHEIAVILSGEMVVQDLESGAVYRGHQGDLFYFAQGLRARLGGAFRSYFVKTPAPTELVKTPRGTKLSNLLRARKGICTEGAPPVEIRKAMESKAVLPHRPLVKFVKGALEASPTKVDSLKGSLDQNWWSIPLVDAVESSLVFTASIARHSETMNYYHDHSWHQIVLILGGEMVTEVLDTGDVYKVHKGDLLYFAPGLKHRVGGNFHVFPVLTPPRWRHIRGPEGNKELNMILRMENEVIYPGSPPDEVRKEPLQKV